LLLLEMLKILVLHTWCQIRYCVKWKLIADWSILWFWLFCHLHCSWTLTF
jgi:hypothetical protein